MTNCKKVVILNSRQALGASGNSEWVKKTVEAVLWIKQKEYALVVSVGMQTWELVLFLAVKYSIPKVIIIPCSKKQSYLSLCSYYAFQFYLDDNITEYLPVDSGDDTLTVEAVRDRYAIELSDIIVPVSVRKNGSMNRLLAAVDKVKLQNRFLTPHKRRTKSLHQRCTDVKDVNDDVSGKVSGFVFHWTRTTYNPWPEERLADYYNDIINSVCYPRSAFKTLERILEYGRIFGSCRHMPDNQRCVSFSGKQPVDFIPLMRWRRRYREMSYEPYGIGIRKSAAFIHGVKKVIYTDSRYDQKEAERWLLQPVGKKGDWTVEDEYRCKGDFVISKIDRKDILIICAAPEEALKLYEKFGITALPMFQNR